MEVTRRFRVPSAEVWFVQAVLTDCEEQVVVSLGERKPDECVITVFYDDSAEGDLAPMFAYLTSVDKIVPVPDGDA